MYYTTFTTCQPHNYNFREKIQSTKNHPNSFSFVQYLNKFRQFSTFLPPSQLDCTLPLRPSTHPRKKIGTKNRNFHLPPTPAITSRREVQKTGVLSNSQHIALKYSLSSKLAPFNFRPPPLKKGINSPHLIFAPLEAKIRMRQNLKRIW